MKYVSVQAAREMTGLRIAFTRGFPGPWGEGVKAIMHVKGLPYTAVEQVAGQDNEALREWTGQSSAPVAMFDDERPRSNWSEILLLAERLSPEPPLIPADESDRVAMFGLCHELCGEDGLGWNARLLMFEGANAQNEQDKRGSSSSVMMRRYTNGEVSLDYARRRVVDVMATLSARLETNSAPYLVGDSLSAADIYWTAFSNLIAPLPDEYCPTPEVYRKSGVALDPEVNSHTPQNLIEHRFRILDDYFKLPMSF